MDQPNLLVNPGFDTDTSGWKTVDHGSGTTEATVDRKVKAGGKGSLRLTRESPRLHPEDGVYVKVPSGSSRSR